MCPPKRLTGIPHSRSLGIECVSECIRPLLSEIGWVNADGMLDTKLVSVLIVDELQSTVVATPLRITTDFECETFVVIKAVPVFKHVTNTEFKYTSLFVPVERVQVVADEAVQLVAVVTGAPIPRR